MASSSYRVDATDGCAPAFPLWPTMGLLLLAAAMSFVGASLAEAFAHAVHAGPVNGSGTVGDFFSDVGFYAGPSLVVLIGLPRLTGVSLRDLGLRWPTWRELGVALLVLGLVQLTDTLADLVQTLVGLGDHVQAGFENFAPQGALAIALSLISGSLLAPFGEELLFRMTVFRALRTRLTLPVAAILSGALFGLLHGDAIDFAPIAISGVLFAYAYARTNCIVVPMLVHGASNFLSFAQTIFAGSST